MNTATRRLWLYGLLLLLPALAVGGLALGLLAREQERLAEREEAARESRRAAVETRARLIAENIELLVGDVQSALMATLAEAPAAEPRAFLTEWQSTNPLVRDVFRATADGRVVWGATSEPLRVWLENGAPWVDATPAPAAPPAPAAASPIEPALADGFAAVAPVGNSLREQKAEPEARRDITNNVQQYQRARQEIQEVAKLKGGSLSNSQSYAVSSATAAPSALLALESVSSDGMARRAAAEADAESAVTYGKTKVSDAPPPRVQDFQVAPEFSVTGGANVFFGRAAAPAPPPPEPLTRSGWTPWRDVAGPHLFGWRELPDRTVIGLELRFDAIKARLGEVFPAAAEPGEAYALSDSGGARWHQVGAEGLATVIEVPLAASALPGWTVVALLTAEDYVNSSSGGVFYLGAFLVSLLIFAILAAGALLLRQARLSEHEAAQKTSFVANVSHELKTPLTTIRLYAELLAEGRVRDETKRADYLVTIGRETQRLGRLVANVLDFSRLEQGKKKYAHAPLDLAAELRRLGETHAPWLAASGLALRVEAPDSLAIKTDRDAVEQIVLNLLDNACKYAGGGGEVLLALSAEGASARLVVADRGPGVPDGQRERIFEKFHRLDDRLTAEKAGAGLGLSIARQLARGLGGDLRCEARAGGGAEFALTLPTI